MDDAMVDAVPENNTEETEQILSAETVPYQILSRCVALDRRLKELGPERGDFESRANFWQSHLSPAGAQLLRYICLGHRQALQNQVPPNFDLASFVDGCEAVHLELATAAPVVDWQRRLKNWERKMQLVPAIPLLHIFYPWLLLGLLLLNSVGEVCWSLLYSGGVACVIYWPVARQANWGIIGGGLILLGYLAAIIEALVKRRQYHLPWSIAYLPLVNIAVFWVALARHTPVGKLLFGLLLASLLLCGGYLLTAEKAGLGVLLLILEYLLGVIKVVWPNKKNRQ